MKSLVHVYYDQIGEQIVMYEAYIDTRSRFIYEDKEIDIHKRDFDTIENREFFIYLGTITDEE